MELVHSEPHHSATYLPGMQNTLGDHLSRCSSADHKWETYNCHDQNLHPVGVHHLGLFASKQIQFLLLQSSMRQRLQGWCLFVILDGPSEVCLSSPSLCYLPIPLLPRFSGKTCHNSTRGSSSHPISPDNFGLWTFMNVVLSSIYIQLFPDMLTQKGRIKHSNPDSPFHRLIFAWILDLEC